MAEILVEGDRRLISLMTREVYRSPEGSPERKTMWEGRFSLFSDGAGWEFNEIVLCPGSITFLSTVLIPLFLELVTEGLFRPGRQIDERVFEVGAFLRDGFPVAVPGNMDGIAVDKEPS